VDPVVRQKSNGVTSLADQGFVIGKCLKYLIDICGYKTVSPFS